jgi:hypothetical protein
MFKILILAGLLASMVSPRVWSLQLSAHATSDNELDARAESLRRLAESIQVNVSGETLISSQFKDNVATQELVDSVKTSTDLTLLGAEVNVMKTKEGYRAEAKIDTQQSFNLYLTKITAEKQLLDSKITLYKQQKSDLAKFPLANDLMLNLSLHIKDYLVATMLTVKPSKNEPVKTPLWMDDLSSKSQWLITLSDYINQLTSSTITKPKLAALMLVKDIKQENVYTCPIFQKNGSWLNENKSFNFEISKLLPLSSQSKEQAQYFLIGRAVEVNRKSTSISYQLFDVNGKAHQKNQVNYALSHPMWQKKPIQNDAVLTSIHYEFKDKVGNAIPENITTKKQLYTLVEKNILNNKTLVVEDPCRPIEQLSSAALTNAYGVSSFISIKVAGKLGTFVLRPDPKEHEFALAKVTFQQTDLNSQNNISNKSAVGKKFPVLEPNDALMLAVDVAFKKLN